MSIKQSVSLLSVVRFSAYTSGLADGTYGPLWSVEAHAN